MFDDGFLSGMRQIATPKLAPRYVTTVTAAAELASLTDSTCQLPKLDWLSWKFGAYTMALLIAPLRPFSLFDPHPSVVVHATRTGDGVIAAFNNYVYSKIWLWA